MNVDQRVRRMAARLSLEHGGPVDITCWYEGATAYWHVRAVRTAGGRWRRGPTWFALGETLDAALADLQARVRLGVAS